MGAAKDGLMRSQGPAGPAVPRLDRGLGALSVALGTVPLLSPRGVARAAGVDEEPQNLALLRAVGARELVVAAALLRRPAPRWMWARVVQDAMDLPLGVRSVLGKRGARRARAQGTLGALAAITALDVYAAVRSSRESGSRRSARSRHEASTRPSRKDSSVTVRAAVTIRRPQEEVSSRWAEAEPPLSDASVSYAPAPGGRGTEVRAVLDKDVPGGAIGQKLAAIVGSGPQRQLDDALRRFKQRLETGEVARSEGSPGGTDAKRQRAQRPAQPVGKGN